MKAKPGNKTYHFYILRCKDGTLYSGITTDLVRREALHNSGKGSTYVRSRGGGKIAYSVRFRNIGSALRREAEVKKWPRSDKLRLIRTGQKRPTCSSSTGPGRITSATTSTPN